jgi:hypothetical protein
LICFLLFRASDFHGLTKSLGDYICAGLIFSPGRGCGFPRDG